MMSKRRIVFLGIACCLGSIAAAAELTVKPVGVYPFQTPELLAKPDGQPKAMLWCQGTNLIGVVVPEDKRTDCGAGSQKRSAPSAILLRDGRCESEGGTVSFGFLVSRRAWVFEPSRRAPTDRTVWLLFRFEGSVNAGQLKGRLVQADLSHPGYPFEQRSLAAQALSDEQASFTGEAAWRSRMAETFCLAAGEP